jgi:hypothetical protein
MHVVKEPVPNIIWRKIDGEVPVEDRLHFSFHLVTDCKNVGEFVAPFRLGEIFVFIVPVEPDVQNVTVYTIVICVATTTFEDESDDVEVDLIPDFRGEGEEVVTRVHE